MRQIASLHARHALLSRPLNHDELRHVAGRAANELDRQIDVADEERVSDSASNTSAFPLVGCAASRPPSTFTVIV